MNQFVFLLPLVVIAIVLLFNAGKTRRWCRVAGILLLLLFTVTILNRNRHTAIFLQSGNHLESLTRYQPHPIDDVPSIWLPGVEDQFEADVYPSKLSAKRAINLRTKSRIDVNLDIETHPVPWSGDSESKTNSGRVEATFDSNNKQITISANFVEKPWVENFADFVNRNPKDKWILTRSQQSCTSQAQAEQQAISNACDKVASLLNQMHKQHFAAADGFTVTAADLRNGSFIADRFAQSFTGTAGRIWRQAILINATQDKLTELVHQKKIAHQSWRGRLIREIISIVGLTVLICVVYLFLNAATRGYYAWSLRIAAVVLTMVGIFLVFTLI